MYPFPICIQDTKSCDPTFRRLTALYRYYSSPSRAGRSASAAQPPFVAAGRIGDKQPARESDSRGQTARSTLFCTKRHMLRMTLVNQFLHATGISPVTLSQSLVNLFLHIAISYCVLLHIHFKLFVPNHELHHPLPRLFLTPQWEVVPRRARGVIRLY